MNMKIFILISIFLLLAVGLTDVYGMSTLVKNELSPMVDASDSTVEGRTLDSKNSYTIQDYILNYWYLLAALILMILLVVI